MQCSYSRIECFKSCPYKYKLRYINRIKVIPPTNADNALILGKAAHTALENGLKAGVREYLDSFPIMDDGQVHEVLKFQHIIPKALEALPAGGFFELEVSNGDFIGYLDYLYPTGQVNEFDMYDFKYSNAVERYEDSGQLHVYHSL